MPPILPRFGPPQPDEAPPPDLSPVFMDQQQPMVRLPQLAAPRVSGPDEGQQQINADQAQLEKVRWAQSHPWGSPDNHPGKLGHIAHALSVAGNIAGNIFAPATMSLIPGTQLNMQEKEGGLAKRLNTEITDEGENKARQAQTEEAQERTREMPETAKRQQEQLNAELAEHGLQVGEDGHITPVSPENYAPSLRAQLQPKSEFESFMRNPPPGYKPTPEDYQRFTLKPLSKEEADSRNAVWDAIAGQYHLPTGQFKEGMSAADATALASSLNNVIARGQGAQKITIDEGKTGTARGDKSYQYNQGELDKLTTPVSSVIQRMGRLQDTLAQGSPQADALVAPELLTVMAGGQGSGLRMNEAEISRIVGGRSKWEDLKAAVNKWSLDPKEANSITPEQRQEIHALVKVVNDKLMAKQRALDDAANGLIGTDDPKEHRQIVQKARQALTSIDEGHAESGGGAAPPRPANVPEGYEFQENGPNGRGWYKPKAVK